MEVLGLEDRVDSLAGLAIETGSFTGIEAELAPDGFSAVGLDGARVAVDPLATSVTGTFDVPPLEITADEYVRFVLDLEGALNGDVSSGEVVYDPILILEASDGETELCFRPLDATVSLRDVGTLALTVEGFADADPSDSIGFLDVIVDAARTVLVTRQRGVVSFANQDYTLLIAGLTTLEVRGTPGLGGTITATRLEIESQDGRPGSTTPSGWKGP